MAGGHVSCQFYVSLLTTRTQVGLLKINQFIPKNRVTIPASLPGEHRLNAKPRGRDKDYPFGQARIVSKVTEIF